MGAHTAPAAHAVPATKTETPSNKIGLGLGLGVVFLPVIFAWFTLRKGHSTVTRVVAFSWMAITSMIWMSGHNERAMPAGQASASAQRASSAIASPPEQAINRDKGLGERFVLGGFAYTVNAIDGSTSIGRGPLKKNASEGAAFLIVDFTIENLGNETETVMADDFKIVDAQGRSFRSSSEGNTALMMSGEAKDFIVTELHPGLQKKMKTAFEIPISLLEQGMTLVIPEKGFGGSDEAHIRLSAGKD